MVRFSYWKITLVSTVESGRKGASQRQESNGDISRTWIKAGYREKGTPTLFPPPTPAWQHSHSQGTVKTDAWVWKRQRQSEGSPHPACSAAPIPKVSHPSSAGSTSLPQAGTKTSRQPEQRSEAAEGESALQSPASVSSSCQASSMCSCSCRVIAMEDETEGQKERSATGSECQVGGGLWGNQGRSTGWFWALQRPLENCHTEPSGSQTIPGAVHSSIPITAPKPGHLGKSTLDLPHQLP